METSIITKLNSNRNILHIKEQVSKNIKYPLQGTYQKLIYINIFTEINTLIPLDKIYTDVDEWLSDNITTKITNQVIDNLISLNRDIIIDKIEISLSAFQCEFLSKLI